jgi:hypothetical protein
MKRTPLLAVQLFLLLSLLLLLPPILEEARARESKGDECCPIVLVDRSTRLVAAKDQETDRVFHFRADVLDMRSLRVGDLASADFETGRVTGIAGAKRDYPMLMWDDSDECCVIRDLDETSGAAVAIDPKSGEAFRIRISPADLETVGVGSAVAVDLNSGGVIVQSFEPIHGNAPRIEAQLEPDWAEICCPAAPNPELTGATGRLAVGSLEGAKPFNIQVFKSGTDQRSKSWYSNEGLTANFLPGDYDVVVNGMRLQNVYLGRGMDTRVRCGALNVTLDSGTAWAIYASDGETRVDADYGSMMVVLPVGTYFVELAGDRMEVAINDGRVTDF